jgi:pSer/pThr/pTyr-binding forkhead associated (FHA) protein
VAIPAAPKPQRQYELVVNIPNEGPRTFPLKRGDNVLGRGDASDIKLPDPEQWLSRKHAMVRVNEDDSIELVDLNGVNGTFVKGARIETARLQPGATFVLGPNLEFKLQEK